ncbi:MAG: PepSY domain-containing protein [Alphaproteobacteria bacterium]|nr:PepSY domain-containing protein [Alphaproteobacteria bacterium]
MNRTIALLAAIGLMLAPAAFADGKGKGNDREPERDTAWSGWTSGDIAQRDERGWGDQFSPGQARDAVKQGRTVPLSRIFQSLKREYGGYQLGADLYSRDSGGAVYEIDWLTDDGRKVHVTVDAETGAVLDRTGC